ncbi:MAG: Acyl-CoA dehydrogenase [Chloroflexi bacterium ADurb.Bin180]|nr:MAG: Acyl-CoA dehydrogenase [Chloroflexi bacterium ADurb.Bin180]HOU23175.1 acyl-CoA dehydrogenase [Anaerolineae bacterium]HQJ50474.1 acyl-CoA dehydrogenase [Anaerolineae bacterium]
MEFELTEEQQMIRRMVREFAEKEIRPIAREIDARGEFPWEVIRKMAGLGLLGLPIPEQYGGSGADTVSYAIAVEEVSRVSGSIGITMAAHTSLGLYPLYRFGSEEQKNQYLPRLASGEGLAAFGLTEPEAGSDAGGVKTTAVLDGDQWVLNGQKTFITSGSIADVVIIAALTDKAAGTRGISNFIVEKGTPGFRPGRDEDKMGLKGSVTSELFFEDCRVPKANLLGQVGEGFKQFLITLDGGRISIGAMALGLAQGALDAAIKYSKERVQFGQPIARFQAIQWMIADMATEIEAARWMIYRAAWLKDKGGRFTKEAAMAKLYASEAAERACFKAIQIHGGYGYMSEYDVERIYRDNRLTTIGEGTSEIQRLVIARQVLGEV